MRAKPRRAKKKPQLRWVLLLVLAVTIGKLSWDLWSEQAHATLPASESAEQVSMPAPPTTTDTELATVAATATQTLTTRPASAILPVPIMQQMPELYNGCEVTSLSMLLNYAGHPVSKLELARNVR